ncbi:MAG: cob(I)yrinic acid a,c-diamide adenosyltransferase [Clostridiales bacterium]|nr:cob(I)yrinic acid a,c-diamide adenosyltransferase [Clostridiales bacterium]
MANIYTKTGDKGTTGLYGGSRVDKDSLNVEVYGTIDEAISTLGMAYAQTSSPDIREHINHIQKRMFQAGAEFASDERGMEMLKDKIGEDDIRYLEDIIDQSTEVNGPMREFVVPGVSPSSATLHVARTIVRRAERKITTLAREVPVREELRKYINRLSDACYAMARIEEARTQQQEIEELKETVRRVVEELQTAGDHKGECKMDMSLRTLKKMAEYVEEKATEIGVPMAFSAVDEGGNLLYFQRMEGSLLISVKVSQDKAYTSCVLKCPTSVLADVTKPGDSLWSLHNSGDGRIVCFGGGYPIEVDGKVIGAIGVSGGTAEEDMAVATYALEKMQGGKA